MKKIFVFAMAAAMLMLTGCGMGTTGSTTASQGASAGAGVGGGILSSVLSAATNGQTVGNVLQSVLGLDKLTQKNLIGTWKYSQPGCAFTSEQLLAQAGGEVIATDIKNRLVTPFQTVGIKTSNTQITFNEDNTFSAKFAGKSFSGRYTFNESTYQVNLQGLILNINCYAKKNSNGIALLFEASKLLTLMQTMAKLSGNSTAQTIGDLSKNYDGLRIGFDFQ